MNRRRRKILMVAGCMVAAPLPVAAQEMCAALQRIAVAAREPVPFASLEGEAQGLVPGYSYCRVETGAASGRVMCHSQMAPKSLIAETVGAQVRDCLGATLVPAANRWSSPEYRTATLAITVESHCDERCHVGRIASLIVERRRADEVPAPR